MVKIGGFFVIRNLHSKGWTQKAIAGESGFDPKKIPKYLNQNHLPKRKRGGKKPRKLDDFKTYIL